MVIKKSNVSIVLNDNEFEALFYAEKILRKIQESLPEDVELMSTLTGEVVMTEELSRTRGVIGAFLDGCNWEIR